jgi:hypothetical protein
MISLFAGVLALATAAQVDTVVVLRIVQRDLTGDGRPEVLRLIGTGRSIDSLDVTFTIESPTEVLFTTALAPLTRIVGIEAGKRELSSKEHHARIASFGDWFFGATKFMRPDEFVEQLREQARLHIARIPTAIARDRRRPIVVDSLVAAGLPRWQAEHRAQYLLGDPLDLSEAARRWEEIQRARVTVFTYSPGGDGATAIAWSNHDQRFYRLWECC